MVHNYITYILPLHSYIVTLYIWLNDIMYIVHPQIFSILSLSLLPIFLPVVLRKGQSKKKYISRSIPISMTQKIASAIMLPEHH